jgi:hypothetical protein
MSVFAMDFALDHGFCVLNMRTDAASVSLRGHWVSDRLPDLLTSITLLLDGTEAVCCRWQGPVQEGHFLDFVRDPHGSISVAVSEFRHPDGATAAEIWSAERGPLRFTANLLLSDFAMAFAAALRQVRSAEVGMTGLLTDYPRPFPQTLFEGIEQKAARLGYKPSADLPSSGRDDGRRGHC